MATIEQMVDVERRMRWLLAREGLREPDEVQYREASVALLWHETKTVVIVDIGEEVPMDG
jgi:hypothetical protein